MALFTLYTATEKGSSAFQSTLVGQIKVRERTMKLALPILTVLNVLPAPLPQRLNIKTSHEDSEG